MQQILNNQYFIYMKNMEKDTKFEYSQSRRRKPDRLIPFLILTVIFIKNTVRKPRFLKRG